MYAISMPSVVGRRTVAAPAGKLAAAVLLRGAYLGDLLRVHKKRKSKARMHVAQCLQKNFVYSDPGAGLGVLKKSFYNR